jgi:hypothetical protein
LLVDNLAAKTDFAVSSTEFRQSKFDERNIGRGLGGGGGQRMIPLHQPIFPPYLLP